MKKTRSSSAHWEGSLKNGNGTLTTSSNALRNFAYSFAKRFEDEPGTNPEELIAAAHAGCFSMAFSSELNKAGYTPESIDTTAAVTLEFVEGAPTVTRSELTMTAKVPGITADEFQDIANGAKSGCPISRLLNADITLDAKLV